MGSAIENAKEWWYFANGWNNDKGDTRNIDEFRLVGDIDFQGNKGIGEVGKDWQNYADYCIEGLGCTSMIVGDSYDKVFTANFDGQGNTLKNINIVLEDDQQLVMYVGIFGNVGIESYPPTTPQIISIKNINVDYMGGGIKGINNKKGNELLVKKMVWFIWVA